MAETEITKAENLAAKHEMFTGIIEVQDWKRKLRQTLHPFDYDTFRKTLQRQNAAIQAQENIQQYWQLALEISDGKSNKNKKSDAMLLRPPSKALSLEAKVLHYNIAYLRDIQLDRGEAAKKQLIELLEMLENNPERLAHEPGFYTSTLNNLLSFLTYNREYKSAMTLIDKAQTIYESWNITSENKILLKQILRTYNIELEMYRQQKDLSNDAKFSHAEAFVQKSRNKMPKEYLISFWFQFASIYFMLRDFDRSLHYINLLLNARFRNIRSDLTAQTQLLNLMVHFEKQNIFVLRYFIDSTRRYLRKSQSLQTYEQIILRFFTRIIRLPNSEYSMAFQQLDQQLFPPNDEALVNESALDYIDFRRWINWNIK